MRSERGPKWASEAEQREGRAIRAVQNNEKQRGSRAASTLQAEPVPPTSCASWGFLRILARAVRMGTAE